MVWIAKSGAFFESPLFPWLIISFGITVRCVQYVANRSLWLDESFLALNIVHRTFSHLLQQLDYEQGAPVGFLMVEKANIQVFGNNEYALRLFPLLCGIASVLLFYRLTKQLLTKTALIIGLTLFVLSGPLTYYSSEVKQYSSDVAIALVLYFFTTLYITRKGLTSWYSALFGIIGSIAIWFSHPAIFVLMGIVTVLALSYLNEKDWGKIYRLAIVCVFLMLNFTVLYFISLRYLAKNDALLDYWAHNFMPLAPFSLSDVRWFLDTFFSLFEYPSGLAFAGLGSLSFLVGCRALWRSHKAEFWLFTLPILFALLASGFKKYPFNGRFLLFIVPSMLILIAQGADEIIAMLRLHDAVIARAFVVLLLLHPGLFAGYYLVKSYMREEIRPLISYMRKHHRPGDMLYLYRGALYAFKYYQERYGLTEVAYVVGHDLSQWQSHVDDLSKISGHPRVWILFSHVSTPERRKEEEVILGQLDSMGKRLATLKQERASVYLYDLTISTPPLKL
jgi:4-amino-4-deoxy-L-arabinose transferase-like glycosyltransferase